jgi:hypothetical protein
MQRFGAAILLFLFAGPCRAGEQVVVPTAEFLSLLTVFLMSRQSR